MSNPAKPEAPAGAVERPSEGAVARVTETSTEASNRRRDPRLDVHLRASTATIDPVHDLVRNETCYQTSADDHVTNLSRRGLRLVTGRPPSVGTRLWVELSVSGDRRPIELVGRTCWTRIQFERGERGARPVCSVGIELLGGSPRALDRFERCLDRFGEPDAAELAASESLR